MVTVNQQRDYMPLFDTPKPAPSKSRLVLESRPKANPKLRDQADYSLSQSEPVVRQLLRELRAGTPIVSSGHDNRRLAATIRELRGSYGFSISGNGKQTSPYVMANTCQYPGLVKTTDEIKAAYYETRHWKDLHQQRLVVDGYRCCQCKAARSDNVFYVHHVAYRLFSENVTFDLMTLCPGCHEYLHANAKLAFPSGIEFDHVRRLGFDPKDLIEPWLLPEAAR